MKPQLVDYDKIFKKKIPQEINTIKKKVDIKQDNNFHFFFNLIGLIIIIIGAIILYYRKKNKEVNKRLYNQRIVQFYHDIN